MGVVLAGCGAGPAVANAAHRMLCTEQPRVLVDLLFGNVTPQANELIAICFQCHQRAALENRNMSTVLAGAVGHSSGSFVHGICASILSTGGAHAPIHAARELLRRGTKEYIDGELFEGRKIPGFGNSFFKDRIDPSFQPLVEAIQTLAPQWWNRIEALQRMLAEAGISLKPNAAILTAAVCEFAMLPDGIEELLFIIPRLPAWAKEFVTVKEAN